MSLICAWCGHWIRREYPVGAISHGICKSCAEKLKFDDEGRAEKTMPGTLKTIKVAMPIGKKEIAATYITPHVAVHRTTLQSGEESRGMWSVSEPVTGRKYPVPSFKTKPAAIAWAKTLVEKFGPNPVDGGKIDPNSLRDKEAWTVKPTHYKDLKKFLNETVYGG